MIEYFYCQYCFLETLSAPMRFGYTMATYTLKDDCYVAASPK